MFDSEYDSSWSQCNRFDLDTLRFVVIETIRCQLSIRCDDAEQRLAKCAAPRPHRSHVASADEIAAGRMRVKEAGDITMRLFALQRPATVEFDLRAFTAGAAHAAQSPVFSAPAAEENPAFFAGEHFLKVLSPFVLDYWFVSAVN
jgi:hypothetical protein